MVILTFIFEINYIVTLINEMAGILQIRIFKVKAKPSNTEPLLDGESVIKLDDESNKAVNN
jgi:hypothetical protein